MKYNYIKMGGKLSAAFSFQSEKPLLFPMLFGTLQLRLASSNHLDALRLGLVEVSVSSVHPEDAQSTKIVKELLEVKVVVTALVLMAG